MYLFTSSARIFWAVRVVNGGRQSSCRQTRRRRTGGGVRNFRALGVRNHRLRPYGRRGRPAAVNVRLLDHRRSTRGNCLPGERQREGRLPLSRRLIPVQLVVRGLRPRWSVERRRHGRREHLTRRSISRTLNGVTRRRSRRLLRRTSGRVGEASGRRRRAGLVVDEFSEVGEDREMRSPSPRRSHSSRAVTSSRGAVEWTTGSAGRLGLRTTTVM
jgi:hypothetical protein